MCFLFFVPLSMQIGGLLFIHLRKVLKTHSNDGIVSSRTSVTANMVLCWWWFTPTNTPSGMWNLLVLYVVSNVTQSPKSSYDPLQLAFAQKTFLTLLLHQCHNHRRTLGLSSAFSQRNPEVSWHHLQTLLWQTSVSCIFRDNANLSHQTENNYRQNAQEICSVTCLLVYPVAASMSQVLQTTGHTRQRRHHLSMCVVVQLHVFH